MANQKISELNSIDLGTLVDTDVFTLVDTSAQETKKIEWGQLKVGQFIGANVSLLVNTTGVDLTGAANIVFDEEKIDNGGWHDNGVNPDRLTVPASYGGSVVDVSASAILTNVASGWMFLRLDHYNAADALQDWRFNRDSPTAATTSVRRGGVTMLNALVNSGDYFIMEIQSTEDAAVDINSSCNFSIKLSGWQ